MTSQDSLIQLADSLQRASYVVLGLTLGAWLLAGVVRRVLGRLERRISADRVMVRPWSGNGPDAAVEKKSLWN
jgi:hypothetical protein